MSFKSRTGSRILTILALHVDIDKVTTMVKCQGHQVKGQGYIHPQPIDLNLVVRNAAINTALAVF